MTPIIRQRTAQERDLTPSGQNGESQGFIDISDQFSTPNKDIEIKKKITTQFHKVNRALLFDAKDIVKEIPNLSCVKCFEIEHQKHLVDDIFIHNFDKFQGRLVLDKVRYIEKRFYYRDALKTDTAIFLIFKRCSYCGKKYKISLNSSELDEKRFQELKKIADTDEGIDLETIDLKKIRGKNDPGDLQHTK